MLVVGAVEMPWSGMIEKSGAPLEVVSSLTDTLLSDWWAVTWTPNSDLYFYQLSAERVKFE